MSTRLQPKPATPRVAKQWSESETRALKRQQEIAFEDCKRICTTDISKPFQTLGQAVESLLPFHIFASQEDEEADMDETSDHMGSNLICGRNEAWAEITMRRAADFARKAEIFGELVVEAEQRYADSRQAPAEEKYLLEHLMLTDRKERANQEKLLAYAAAAHPQNFSN